MFAGEGGGIILNIKPLLSFLDNPSDYEYTTDTPASELTSFRVGGPVSVVAYPKNKGALCALLRFLSEREIRHTVLGCCSNVLAPDEGYDGVFVVTTKMTALDITDEVMTAECGRGITSCASAAQKAGLSGLEFAYGIPGSVGGAVFMNAGAYGSEVANVITKAECYDPATRKFHTFTREELCLGYRDSILRHNGMIVLSAEFALNRRDPDEIMAEMADYMSRRRDKQPLEYPSAGSVFKRAPGHFTGKLIEDAGLKGARIGGAEVSEKHAGFIVNRGGATAADVKALVSLIEARIYELYGVALERELIYL